MRRKIAGWLWLLPLATLLLADPSNVLAQGKPEGTPGGKPEDAGPPEGKGKPAKISWQGCRLTMTAFETQATTQISFTSNLDIESADLWVSGSLNGVFDFAPSSFSNVLADQAVPIDVTLNTTPCEEGRTIGGTVHLRSDGRTLARPCAVSLKRDACDLAGQDAEPSDQEDDQIEDDSSSAPITWFEGGGGMTPLEELTEDQFDGAGKATVEFCSTDALDAVNIRLTPSLGKCLMLTDPTSFPIAVAADECVALMFMLTKPAEEFTSSCGGTVHVRNDGSPPKTFAEPLSVDLFDDVEAEEVVPSAIVNGASFASGPVAPGQIVSIFGLGLGPQEQAVFSVNEDGLIVEDLGGTLVLFDGIPAPLLSSYRGQINTIVPMAVAGNDVELRVIHLGKQSAPFPVPVGPAAPALFTLNGMGSGQAAAINTDGSLNGPSNAARRGTVIQLFGTGGGPTISVLGDGEIAGSAALQLAASVTVLIDGIEADVLFAGVPSGLVNGVVQINARIPHGISLGPQDITVIIDGVPSAVGVTIAIQ